MDMPEDILLMIWENINDLMICTNVCREWYISIAYTYKELIWYKSLPFKSYIHKMPKLRKLTVINVDDDVLKSIATIPHINTLNLKVSLEQSLSHLENSSIQHLTLTLYNSALTLHNNALTSHNSALTSHNKEIKESRRVILNNVGELTLRMNLKEHHIGVVKWLGDLTTRAKIHIHIIRDYKILNVYECIALLPNLVSLNVYQSSCFSSKQLDKFRNSHLQHLNMAACSQLDNDAMEIILSLKHLKSLDIVLTSLQGRENRNILKRHFPSLYLYR